jgi:3'5'-cyclic nucleotide phosphodiesterase
MRLQAIFLLLTRSYMMKPVRADLNNVTSQIVAVMFADVAYDIPLKGLIPPSTVGAVDVVIRNSCQQSISYRVDKDNALFVEFNDTHEGRYDSMEFSFVLNPSEESSLLNQPSNYRYTLVSGKFRSCILSACIIIYVVDSNAGLIDAMYNSNAFHNFEHASHVTMSIVKLLSRIVKPSDRERGAAESSLHDRSYGITSDPLTQFACAFCGLIHDADHPGVPNAQLIKEDADMGSRYKERSVAEQNSQWLCFNLLSEDRFSNLRRVLFASNEDQARFRGLVVSSVMATDIVDKDLKELRNGRW